MWSAVQLGFTTKHFLTGALICSAAISTTWAPAYAYSGGGSGSGLGQSGQPAGGCVVQTLIGPTNVWKYRNNCSQAVRATVRRTCYSSSSSNDFREVTISVGAGQDYDFNRPLMFGSYCEPPYNTLSEGIVSQVYE